MVHRSGSQNILVTTSNEDTKEEGAILRLEMTKKEGKNVHWDQNTIDNENSGKKKSKGIYTI